MSPGARPSLPMGTTGSSSDLQMARPTSARSLSQVRRGHWLFGAARRTPLLPLSHRSAPPAPLPPLPDADEAPGIQVEGK